MYNLDLSLLISMLKRSDNGLPRIKMTMLWQLKDWKTIRFIASENKKVSYKYAYLFVLLL